MRRSRNVLVPRAIGYRDAGPRSVVEIARAGSSRGADADGVITPVDGSDRRMR